MSLALLKIERPGSESGCCSDCAMAVQSLPWSSPGSTRVPEIMSVSAMSRNGMEPSEPAAMYGAASYFCMRCCWSAVGVCSGAYPFPWRLFVVPSTDENARYWLVYEARAKVNVGVDG